VIARQFEEQNKDDRSMTSVAGTAGTCQPIGLGAVISPLCHLVPASAQRREKWLATLSV